MNVVPILTGLSGILAGAMLGRRQGWASAMTLADVSDERAAMAPNADRVREVTR